MDQSDLVLIGWITTSHGVKGELKLHPVTEDRDLLANLDQLTLEIGGKWTIHEVQRCRPAKDHWILQLKEITNRNQSDELKKAQVYVDEADLSPLSEGEFFIHDLIDATCFSTEGEELGIIVNSFESGAQTIFEVKGKHNFLFPASEEILQEILPDENKVIIQLIEGLLELNQSKKK